MLLLSVFQKRRCSILLYLIYIKRKEAKWEQRCLMHRSPKMRHLKAGYFAIFMVRFDAKVLVTIDVLMCACVPIASPHPHVPTACCCAIGLENRDSEQSAVYICNCVSHINWRNEYSADGWWIKGGKAALISSWKIEIPLVIKQFWEAGSTRIVSVGSVLTACSVYSTVSVWTSNFCFKLSWISCGRSSLLVLGDGSPAITGQV